jgi:hypothetical protein
VGEKAQRPTVILRRARNGHEQARGELVAVATVENDWRLARAGLAGQLGG